MGEMVYRVALAGNPNVGKSTMFNALTGMHQHTGNWAGKTVACAEGCFCFEGAVYQITDLPGTYSLRARSAEEEAARAALASGEQDAVIVVCDACCLERNLCLALQVMELAECVILAVNLADEAEKKGIRVDSEALSRALGIPVVMMSARDGKGLEMLQKVLSETVGQVQEHRLAEYGEVLEERIRALVIQMEDEALSVPLRWAAVRLLENDAAALPEGIPAQAAELAEELRQRLAAIGYPEERIRDMVIGAVVRLAEEIAGTAVSGTEDSDRRDRRTDRILADRRWGLPVLAVLLGGVLWLTMVGANYPSSLLTAALFRFGEWGRGLLVQANAPDWLVSLLADGIYRVVAWVVSVMLPPMAIFFPLFTLLEDAGYLPRVAFLLDKRFRKAGACGKQSLTMCMGLGCNACGVTGCRIIDSPRERLIAVLTNVFVPCNGRFPLLITLIGMFFAGGTIRSALVLMAVILCGVGMTLLMSKCLSVTVLKGTASSFTLELPPYRRPQIGKVLVRSLLDRTVLVLGRAIVSAAPAGCVIWCMANLTVDGRSLLACCTQALDPAAAWFGMDGTILLAFILGFPANEIVLPIILMSYLAQGTLVEPGELSSLHALLCEHGWTWVTALCTMTFSLLHFPCATTMLTIRKETNSRRWTALAMVLPTVCGLTLCFCIRMIGLLAG